MTPSFVHSLLLTWLWKWCLFKRLVECMHPKSPSFLKHCSTWRTAAVGVSFYYASIDMLEVWPPTKNMEKKMRQTLSSLRFGDILYLGFRPCWCSAPLHCLHILPEIQQVQKWKAAHWYLMVWSLQTWEIQHLSPRRCAAAIPWSPNSRIDMWKRSLEVAVFLRV